MTLERTSEVTMESNADEVLESIDLGNQEQQQQPSQIKAKDPSFDLTKSTLTSQGDEDDDSTESYNFICGQREQQRRKLSYWQIVMIMTTWNTSGSVVTMPYTYGVLGYVLAPLLQILWFGLVIAVGFYICDFCFAAKQPVKTMGDLGYILAGKTGRRFFVTLQLANMVLYMPVALFTTALSLQYLFDYHLGDCVGYWSLITFGILFFLSQFVRTYHHVGQLAFFTVLLAIVKSYFLLPYAYVRYESDVKSDVTYEGKAWAFGHPGSSSWHEIGIALSSFPYTFTPIYLFAEILHETEDKTTFKSAFVTASGLQLSFYMVAGLTAVLLWGWNIEDPVTLEIPYGAVGITLSAFVAFAVLLDYLLTGVVVNDLFENTFLKNHRRNDWRTQLLKSAPTALFSLAIVLSVPNFKTLVGVVTGFSIIGSNTWLISTCWEIGKRVVPGRAFWMHTLTVIGIPFTLWVTAASLYDIIKTDYTSGFFCSGS